MYDAFLVIQLACVGILLVLYSLTLTHAIKGSKFTFVIVQTIFLLASNVGTLINIYGTYLIYVESDNPITVADILFKNLGLFMQDSFFCTSHWLLAAQYHRIAVEMP